VAVHLSCHSLRSGDSILALAGGVSLMLAPEMMITLSKIGFMSPSGRCRTFDARADGFVRGEGCGVVVLKRLSDAISDNDRVLAVIRGSAVNQDGRSTVLAAPNGLAQEALLRDALENAQLTPDRVGFVETHGTATPLGDPIEVEALASVLGAPRSDGSPCVLGSAKANLGHLEAASGVAGLIKATLVLMHREIPGQVHFEKLNPHLSLAGTCLEVADRHRAWPATSQPRVAGVSGFGVGGTNAHVLLEEAPSLPAPSAPAAEELRLLALSAQSPAALDALASRWRDFLPQSTASAAELAETAGARRSHYDHRLALLGRSNADFERELRALLGGDLKHGVQRGQRPQGGAPRVAFVFSGQGPQWARMGVALAACEPVFRDALADLDARFSRLSGWSLSAALAEPEATSRLGETEFAQPALFAVQVALAALWASWGILPDVVVGHSIGELAALHVAGVLTRDDAVRIVWHRGRIMQRATGHGRMASVSLTAEEAHALVASLGSELSVAAINGPRSVVLAGGEAALAEALAKLAERGVSQRMLPVSYAFHSAQMEPFQAELVAAIGGLEAQPARIPVFSSVSGRALADQEIDAAYFGRNIRQTVRFAPAVDAMLALHPPDVFVELAPHPALAASVTECLTARDLARPVLASMRRQGVGREPTLHALAGLYAAGCSVRWEALTPARTIPVDLPAYPWQRERFWLREPPAKAPPSAHAAAEPWLGARRQGANGALRYDVAWPSEALGWLRDHVVAEGVVAPAAALLESMRAAAREALGSAPVSVLDFTVQRPLALDANAGFSVLVSRHGDELQLALWTPLAEDTPDPRRDRLVATARARCAEPEVAATAEPARDDDAGGRDEAPDFYARMAELGVAFGPAFRTLERWRPIADGAEGWLALAPDLQPAPGAPAVHPTLLDGALQLCFVAASGARADTLVLPIAIERYSVYGVPSARLRARARITRGAGGSITGWVQLFSADGALVASVSGARFVPTDASALSDLGPYEVRWHALPTDAAPAPDARGTWWVLTQGSAPARQLIDALTARGARCVALPATAVGSAAFSDLLSDATRAGGERLRGILHMTSLDATSPDDQADWLTTGSALSVVQALGARGLRDVPLWLVTQGAQPVAGQVLHAQQAGLWGLANVVAAEYPELPCHVLDLDPQLTQEGAARCALELTCAHAPGSRRAWRGATRYVPRFERSESKPAQDHRAGLAKLTITQPGTLDGLSWQAAQVGAPSAGQVRLRVLAAGINFRDVLLTLGMYPGEGAQLGAECAGVVEALGPGVTALAVGDLVFGFAPSSLSGAVTVPAHFLAKLPARVSVAEAAALPAAFLTAMFGLEHVAQIRAGARVLIHAGAGGVGLAAIQVALRRGCRVFATAGSAKKRELLLSLGVERVFDSRSLSFGQGVREATDGAGVDVVLNSLSGEFIPEGLRALAPRGWFLELGKREIWTPARVAQLRPDVSYRAYDLGDEVHADATLAPALLSALVAALADGTLRPLPVRSFAFAQVTEAFRVMAQAQHIGKLVLLAPNADADRPLVSADATYWITGGAGALGVRTARWLAQLGARHLVLSGRHAPGAESQAILDECSALGARVVFRAADAADEPAMRAVRDEICAAWPPLRGVVHAAGVVDDGVLAQQTWERWRETLRGKARGARVLDHLTRSLSLDFFVLYSSVGWLLGPLGQGAYAAANAELDALAWERRAHGLPALSVGWGQLREGGMARRMLADGRDPWSARGLRWIGAREGFLRLERLLRDGATYGALLPIDWGRFLAQLPPGVDAGFFQALAPRAAPSREAPKPAEQALIERWRQAPAGARRGLVMAHLAECARHVLGVPAEFPLDEQAPLKEAGLDSLMAVELRNLLVRSLATSLPATLLFDYPSLGALAAYLSDALQLAFTSAPQVSAAPDAAYREVAALSDAEAEALLLAELEAPQVTER